MITLESVTKRFIHENVRTTALNNISLTVKQGEFVAVMGPSGCGKSTLLSVIGLLAKFDEGSYKLDNTDIGSLSINQTNKCRTDKISFIFQSFNLIENLTVKQNIELPLIYAGINSRERAARVEEALAQTNITNRARHYPGQLSGGQQQRVAIARAIITRPAVILADEPTGNLDSHYRTEVMNLLEALNREGSTIVMVTHSEEDAQYASRVIRMSDGKITSAHHETVRA